MPPAEVGRHFNRKRVLQSRYITKTRFNKSHSIVLTSETNCVKLAQTLCAARAKYPNSFELSNAQRIYEMWVVQL